MSFLLPHSIYPSQFLSILLLAIISLRFLFRDSSFLSLSSCIVPVFFIALASIFSFLFSFFLIFLLLNLYYPFILLFFSFFIFLTIPSSKSLLPFPFLYYLFMFFHVPFFFTIRILPFFSFPFLSSFFHILSF